MSIIRTVHLYCDGPDCPLKGEAFRGGVNGGAAIEQRQMARRFHGWRYVKGKDYCPECWAKVRKRGAKP